MKEEKVFVYVELEGVIYKVGLLWFRSIRGKESASFQYDQDWLNHHEKFSLEPALTLTDGTYHTGNDTSLFGAMGDSAPDRWGRILMRRLAAREAKEQNKQPQTLTEIDYLLGVYDEVRQGALRFKKDESGPFLQHSNATPVPPLIELPKLLSAAENVASDKESDEDLRLLLAPGSSLGGARPKASVKDRNGALSFAKFPRSDDEFSIVLWEATALTLAKKAGIEVPTFRVEYIANKPTLILERFDRTIQSRIPFLSGLSMIGGKDNEQHSYLEVADAITQHSGNPTKDLTDLWRRIVFNILISNTDDHLRNLGFLYQRPKGWQLSPMYDLNPTPVEIKPRKLTTSIDFYDNSASLALALHMAKDYGLDTNEAKKIAKEVGLAVSGWKKEAQFFKISSPEIERMSSAFLHKDLEEALNF